MNGLVSNVLEDCSSFSIQSASLSARLSKVIAELERSAKTAQMISINASVIAVKARSAASESYAFEAVADQIKTISEQSICGIGGLRKILGEFRELSATINIAGRQRMITQKVMKLLLIRKIKGSSQPLENELSEAVQLFESTLAKLKGSELNTPKILKRIEEVEVIWRLFRNSTVDEDLDRMIDQNNEVLRAMNDTVMLYEDLVGS